MRNQHHWTETAEDGAEIEWRATKFGGRWEFKRRCPEEASWQTVKKPTSPLLTQFRELLWRKYQRKRLPYEDVTAIERLRDDAIREEGSR